MLCSDCNKNTAVVFIDIEDKKSKEAENNDYTSKYNLENNSVKKH